MHEKKRERMKEREREKRAGERAAPFLTQAHQVRARAPENARISGGPGLGQVGSAHITPVLHATLLR